MCSIEPWRVITARFRVQVRTRLGRPWEYQVRSTKNKPEKHDEGRLAKDGIHLRRSRSSSSCRTWMELSVIQCIHLDADESRIRSRWRSRLCVINIIVVLVLYIVLVYRCLFLSAESDTNSCQVQPDSNMSRWQQLFVWFCTSWRCQLWPERLSAARRHTHSFWLRIWQVLLHSARSQPVLLVICHCEGAAVVGWLTFVQTAGV